MEKFIGIVIPDEIKAKAVEFCTQYDPNLTEPYMPLISAAALQNVKGIDRKMQSFCLSQPPFKTNIGGPNVERSDKGKALYLTVMMGPLNTVRDKLVKHLRVQGEGFFRARLLLVEDYEGSSYNFDAMLAFAKEDFSKPQEFSVKALAIYSRERPGEVLKLDTSYPFTGR